MVYDYQINCIAHTYYWSTKRRKYIRLGCTAGPCFIVEIGEESGFNLEFKAGQCLQHQKVCCLGNEVRPGQLPTVGQADTGRGS